MKLSGSISERELAEAVKRHEQPAMGLLYKKYIGLLSSVCYRYVPNDEDAKDVLQDSFIRIFTSIGSFSYRGEGSLKAWMKKVAVSRALNFLRVSHRLETSEMDVADMNIMDEPAPDTTILTDDELHEAVRSLPDGYRTVLNLYVFEGKSHREIAGILGIHEGSSASQYYHAKRLLAQRIKDYINKRK